MGETPARAAPSGRYVAVIDQDKVTDEVRDIAVTFDPLNQGGREAGFHVTVEGELHIDDAVVLAAHRLIANKIPNDAIKIVRLPAERGQLTHQYGENGFRLYELPAPVEDGVIGLLGSNGGGKSTAIRILAGVLKPNLGRLDGDPDWETIAREFRGTAVQTYLEKLGAGNVRTAYKPQHVDRLADRFGGTVRDLLEERDERNVHDVAIERFDLAHVLDRAVETLSGGELQRAAIAATVVAEADVYLLDEPSSYLDIGQRLTVARALDDLATNERVMVVDHDLVTLDIISDSVHVVYGEPGGFGIVSRPLSTRLGINRFLDGYLREENVRIRDSSIDFRRRGRRRSLGGDPVLEYPAMTTKIDSFTLEVEPGAIHEGEVLGVFGPNGTGKTTFAKLLAGDLDPEEGPVGETVRIAYKPQYLEPGFEGSVRDLFTSHAGGDDRAFETSVRDSFGLDRLDDRELTTLSGGELQLVSIALALARSADLYLFDEPSAYLDVEQRLSFANVLRRFVHRDGRPCLVIDHDLLLLEYLADRAMVFAGEPGARGVGRSPQPVHDGLNQFLQTVGTTFRKDPATGRPRANKPDSQKDRAQKASNTYYAVEGDR